MHCLCMIFACYFFLRICIFKKYLFSNLHQIFTFLFNHITLKFPQNLFDLEHEFDIAQN